MRVLLDECVTRKLKRDLQPHEVHTIEQAGLKGRKNGELLRLASGRYDVPITVDQNIKYQQQVQSSGISILVLAARRSSYDCLRPLIGPALEALKHIKVGEVVIVTESKQDTGRP